MAEESRESSNYNKLGEYLEDCLNLDEKTFVQHHAGAFLLHHGPIGRLKKWGNQATVATEGSGTSPDRPFNPKSDFLVFEVKLRETSDAEDTIWLGRSESNDVVIDDSSVSAVHAFIRTSDGGGYFLQDMNSTNGSYVDDERVASQGDGSPAGLRTGARVVFGSVSMTFLHASDFRNLVKRLLG